MINKNVVIGSGFSSLGAVLGLQKKRKNFKIITGNATKSGEQKNIINLPSRNFDKFKTNIFQSYKINNLRVNTKSNFISYLGFGGLSNLWGKVFNMDVEADTDSKNYLINKLEIKNHKKIHVNKNLKFYRIKEQHFDIKKFYKNLYKNKKKIINETVDKLKYNEKKKVFEVHLTNKKIIKSKNLYLACGIFSSLRLLKTLNKNIFKNKIKLRHSDMCYGIFFVKKKNIKKNIGNEFIYFDNKNKQFAGRISILNDLIIKKYSMNFIFSVLVKVLNFFDIKIFALSVLYKRPANSSLINVNNKVIKINATKTIKNNYILDKVKDIFKHSFKGKMFIFKTTLVGSDFHYTCSINKNIRSEVVKKFDKNIFILDSTYSTNYNYFPTFQMVCDSLNRVRKNISLNKII